MMTFPFFRPMLCMAPDAGGAGGDAAADEQTVQAESAQAEAPATPQAEAQDAPAAPEQPAEPKPDTERAQDDAQNAEQSETPDTLRERVAAMQAKLGEYQLRTAAALAGVPQGRIAYVMRMADVDGLDPSAPDAAERYRQAIDRVLADVPELRGGAGTGSAGNFARRPVDENDPDVERIRRNILG